jgi:hypothetical protein
MINSTWIIILGLLVGLDTFAQSQSIKVDSSINKYFVDKTEYTQITITYSNTTSDYYILWLDSQVDSLMTNDEKVRNYYYVRKGDFTLADLIHEHLINEIPTRIYLTFYKILEPTNQFTFIFLSTDKNMEIEKVLSELRNQIVLIKSSDTNRLPTISHLEKLNYKGEFISIPVETLKFHKNK